MVIIKNANIIKELKNLYREIKPEIESKFADFDHCLKIGDEENIFAELIFCLFTPQSNAKLCWQSVESMRKKHLLINGDRSSILNEMNRVRFKYKKSHFVVYARDLFVNSGRYIIRNIINGYKNNYKLREWLVKNVKGFGYKEASHFIRNIGKGENVAILDRHIIKSLVEFNIINNIPKSLSDRKYILLEKKMLNFTNRIDIPIEHLDLVFWYRIKGEIFK